MVTMHQCDEYCSPVADPSGLYQGGTGGLHQGALATEARAANMSAAAAAAAASSYPSMSAALSSCTNSAFISSQVSSASFWSVAVWSMSADLFCFLFFRFSCSERFPRLLPSFRPFLSRAFVCCASQGLFLNVPLRASCKRRFSLPQTSGGMCGAQGTGGASSGVSSTLTSGNPASWASNQLRGAMGGHGGSPPTAAATLTPSSFTHGLAHHARTPAQHFPTPVYSWYWLRPAVGESHWMGWTQFIQNW